MKHCIICVFVKSFFVQIHCFLLFFVSIKACKKVGKEVERRKMVVKKEKKK